MLQQKVPVITIDGPSGVGKGALSLGLARHLNWNLLDSGAVYRAFALYIKELDILPSDTAAIVAQLAHFNPAFEATEQGVEVLLDNRVVTERIRGEQLGNFTSQIAVIPEVRSGLLALQHDFRRHPGLVADGRDMGTVVFPDATLKLFLDASSQERAKRRMTQLRATGNDVTFSEILSEVEQRDARDRQRTIAPLKPASDAIIIDSTELSIEQVLKVALDYTDNLKNSNL